MVKLLRTASSNTDFHKLVVELDKELATRNGDANTFFAQFNKISHINHVVLAYDGMEVIGCGAIKPFNGDTMEVKRMYVPIERRQRGIASLILHELESWAKEMNYATCILETGLQQPEAIQLYKKNFYKVIPNYGQYQGVEGSICFEKSIG